MRYSCTRPPVMCYNPRALLIHNSTVHVPAHRDRTGDRRSDCLSIILQSDPESCLVVALQETVLDLQIP